MCIKQNHERESNCLLCIGSTFAKSVMILLAMSKLELFFVDPWSEVVLGYPNILNTC